MNLPLNVVDSRLVILQSNIEELARKASSLAHTTDHSLEFAGLAQAFSDEAEILRRMRADTPDSRYAALNSVQNNIRHIQREYPDEIIAQLDAASNGELRTWL
jgi:hypothetical protein